MRMRTMWAVVVIVVLMPGAVLAGPLATHSDAWWDPVGGFFWRGSTSFANGNLSATVDWCVFGPGDYAGTGYTPAANEFVYAYQIITTGTAAITQLTVNMIESNEANNIGDDASLVGGAAPIAAAFGAPPPALQTANWFFAGMVSPDESDALVYSSVNMPLWDNMARIIDDGTYTEGPVPTPSNVIPEPATFALLAMGLAAVLRRRKR